MSLTDAARITAQTQQPGPLMLWRALQPLRGLVRFMNSGAHPDDETSGMLAALTFRDGLSLSYVCSTRGEGGQNDIGREAGADLGTLRTAEMHRAADVLGLSMYWLSDSPGDPISDFGFSKSGVETLGKWGHAHTLQRLVEAIRADRPDILCPTFLNIPGQHGHHRAMTQAAHEAMAAAADPKFDAAGAAWQVAKLYLPAWSGAGDAYDDDLPPPPATLHIPGAGREEPSGWTWAEIGQHSRVFHATQGMGRWTGGTEPGGWPLHLAQTHVGADHTAITDNLPTCFDDLVQGGNALDQQLAATLAAFPDTGQILQHGFAALRALRTLRDTCPDMAKDQMLHRLARSESQLSRVLWLASYARLTARLGQNHAHPGDSIAASLTLEPAGAACEIRADWLLPKGWTATDSQITLTPDAPPFNPYPMIHHAHAPQGPVGVKVTLTLGKTTATLHLPADSQLLTLPQVEGDIVPRSTFLNSAHPHDIPLRLSPGAAITAPPGWTFAGDTLTPHSPPEGLTELALTVAGKPAQSVTRISHPNTGALIRCAPATLRLRVANVALAPARIAYIGGGHDRVDHWLRAMGANVTTLADDQLTAQNLAEFDSLVIGIFAMRFRPTLPALMPIVHDWINAGGSLLTLYHRPWDNWSAQTAPRPIEIGKPSLRFRVTDEAAVVTYLLPDHPALNTPNEISAGDWDGWVKERGLYFAKSWDPAYHPLLQMADAGEAPQQGALLSARIGKGQHHHCALILHLQMEALVPGAFRLMANLTAPR